MPSSGQTASPVPPPSGGVTLPVAITDGGTGATSASAARTALNVPSIPVSVANGGTGATDATTARSNLGIVSTGGWPSGIFGDASDGSIDFDGSATFAFATKSGSTYTLSRGVYAQNVTVRAGVTVNKVYALYVKGTLTLEATGVLADNGNNASGLAAGVATVSSARLPESVGQLGGVGRSTLGTGNAGTNSATSIGGAGGLGGDPSTAQGGGAGGTVTAPTVNQSRYREGLLFITTMTLQGGTTQVLANGGAGGGGGGASVRAGTATSGGGGGGAPVSMLFASSISNAGKITNNGGNGANAVLFTGDGQAGGGGGGGGGYLVIVSNTPQASAGTIETLGGTGGTSLGAGCANALAGANGTLDYRAP